MSGLSLFFFFFFFNDTATTEIYTLSLHDALPIFRRDMPPHARVLTIETVVPPTPGPHLSKELDIAMMALPGGMERTQEEYAPCHRGVPSDRKSTRLNSSHGYISYAVFCLKKKNIYYPSCPTQP